MRKFLSLFVSFFFQISLFGQTDSVPAPAIQIANARLQLLQSFENDDRLNTQYWLDSLQRLENIQYQTLYWDERWLLYLWLENYTPLFFEVEQFLTTQEENTMQEIALIVLADTSASEKDVNITTYKILPPKDSLFTRLDSRLFDNQAYLFDQARKAWLSTEERAFTSLLINYLLRLSNDDVAKAEFDASLNGFLKKFPNSRFAPFIQARMYNLPQAAKWAIGLDVLFINGNWTQNLERSFRPMFGADLAFTYWQNRLSYSLRTTFGGQKLARDLEANMQIWPKDDPSTFFLLELEVGYDIYNKPGIRIYPSIGAGFSTLRPQEDEEDPLPNYYSNFKFTGLHWTTALQADIKFKMGKGNIASSYHGLRIRLGRHWLSLDKENPFVEGDMFFFAVGYTLFSRQAKN